MGAPYQAGPRGKTARQAEHLRAVPHSTRRMLGNLALPVEVKKIWDKVLTHADELTTSQAFDFSRIVQELLHQNVAERNATRHQRAAARKDAAREKGIDVDIVSLLPPAEHLIPPNLVLGRLTDYYHVFHVWPKMIPPEELERIRRDWLKRYIDHAEEHQAEYREIDLAFRLQTDLEREATPEAGEAMTALIAAYGWALQPHQGEERLELFRLTDTVQFNR
jgi:hypothetical protein